MSCLRVREVGYNVEVAGSGPPLVLLHGFTGSSESWSTFASPLEQSNLVIRVDLLGHGRSEAPADSRRYAMNETIADLLAVFERLGLREINLLGYSMGGRIALGLAIAEPDRVDRLILESASPGISSASEREDRVRSDAILAAILDRDGLASFIDRWEQAPLFSTQQHLSPDIRRVLREQRLRGSATGLANSLRGMGTGMMVPLHDQLPRLRCPTLVIVGEDDQKYRATGETLVGEIPNARLVVVSGSGHAVHLERPAAFLAAVSVFLKGGVSAVPAVT